jgi:hypothetical protein
MKYIFSFWSKPFLHKSNSLTFEQSKEKLTELIICHFLSFRVLEQISDDIELVTDDYGASILKDIGYKKIKNNLNDLSSFHNDLWALGKIYALSLYDEPVCHIDADFMIKNPEQFEQIMRSPWDAIVQSRELANHYNTSYRDAVFQFVHSNIKEIYYGHDIKEIMTFDNYHYSYNCGVLGFKNIKEKKDFIKKCLILYNIFNSKEKISFYYETLDLLSKKWHDLFPLNINCLLEQYFFTIWSNYRNIYVKELMPLHKWRLFRLDGKMNNVYNRNELYDHYIGDDKAILSQEIQKKALNLNNS